MDTTKQMELMAETIIKLTSQVNSLASKLDELNSSGKQRDTTNQDGKKKLATEEELNAALKYMKL